MHHSRSVACEQEDFACGCYSYLSFSRPTTFRQDMNSRRFQSGIGWNPVYYGPSPSLRYMLLSKLYRGKLIPEPTHFTLLLNIF